MMVEKGFIATNWFKLVITGSIGLVFALYLMNGYNLDACIENTDNWYNKRWTEECSKKKMKSNCELPFIGAQLNKSREDSIDQCFRRYGYK